MIVRPSDSVSANPSCVARTSANEFLPGPPPASSALQVTALAVPGMLVEVEAIAVL